MLTTVDLEYNSSQSLKCVRQEAGSIRLEAETTKERASQLLDEAMQLERDVQDVTRRLEEYERQGEEDERLASEVGLTGTNANVYHCDMSLCAWRLSQQQNRILKTKSFIIVYHYAIDRIHG